MLIQFGCHKYGYPSSCSRALCIIPPRFKDYSCHGHIPTNGISLHRDNGNLKQDLISPSLPYHIAVQPERQQLWALINYNFAKPVTAARQPRLNATKVTQHAKDVSITKSIVSTVLLDDMADGQDGLEQPSSSRLLHPSQASPKSSLHNHRKLLQSLALRNSLLTCSHGTIWT